MKRIALMDSRDPELGRQNPGAGISYEGFLAYSLLFDPGILSAAQTLPDTFTPEGERKDGEYGLILFPNRFTGSLKSFSRITAGDVPVFLVLPTAEQLDTLSPDIRKACFEAPDHEHPVLSNRERWDVGKPYRYPGDLEYLTLKEPPGNPSGFPLGSIGGRPDLAVFNTPRPVIVSAADRFRGLAHYRFYGLIGDFSEHFCRQFVRCVRYALGFEPGIAFTEEQEELRKDFRAFGFVWGLLSARFSRAGKKLPAEAVGSGLVRSADLLVQGDVPGARNLLRKLFTEAAELRKSILPGSIYILDGFHTGILLKDRGFSELEWPEYAARWITNLIDFGKSTGYRFSIEAAAQSMANLCRRFPALKPEIAGAVEAGIAELVNGTEAQPYIHLYSADSAVRQFSRGHETFRLLFNTVPETYAVQEFAFSGSLPSLLKDFGYRFVNNSALHKGTCPAEPSPLIHLAASRNRGVPALPSPVNRSEKDPVFQFWNVLDYLEASGNSGSESCVLVNFCDQMYHPHFREEAYRASRYSDVIGTFLLHRELRDILSREEGDFPLRGYTMDDYGEELMAGWKYDGDILAIHEQTRRLESAVKRLGAVSALAWTLGIGDPDFPLLADSWRILTEYQHHDILLVPRTYTGSHTGTYACYQGPRELVFLGDCVDGQAREAEEMAVLKAEQLAGEIAAACEERPREEGGGPYQMIFNLSGVPRKAAADRGTVTLPPFSFQAAGGAAGSCGCFCSKEDGTALLRNSFAEYRIDTEGGGIERAVLRSARGDRVWRCVSRFISEAHPELEFRFKPGQTDYPEETGAVCRLSGEGLIRGRTAASLDIVYALGPDSSVLTMNAEISFLEDLGFFSDGDAKNRYWKAALRVRYRIPADHRAVRNCMDFAEDSRKLRTASPGYFHIRVPGTGEEPELHIGHLNSGRIYYEHGNDYFDHLAAVPGKDGTGLVRTAPVRVQTGVVLSAEPGYTPFAEASVMTEPVLRRSITALPGSSRLPYPEDPFKIRTSQGVFPYSLECGEGNGRPVSVELKFLDHTGGGGWAEFEVPRKGFGAVLADTAGNTIKHLVPEKNRYRIELAPGDLVMVIIKPVGEKPSS